jgi:hypothetical protein
MRLSVTKRLAASVTSAALLVWCLLAIQGRNGPAFEQGLLDYNLLTDRQFDEAAVDAQAEVLLSEKLEVGTTVQATEPAATSVTTATTVATMTAVAATTAASGTTAAARATTPSTSVHSGSTATVAKNGLLDGLMNQKCDEAMASFGLMLQEAKCSATDKAEARDVLAKVSEARAKEEDWNQACNSTCVLEVVQAAKATISSGCELQNSKSTVFHQLLKRCKAAPPAVEPLVGPPIDGKLLHSLEDAHEPPSSFLDRTTEPLEVALKDETKESFNGEVFSSKLAQVMNVMPSQVDLQGVSKTESNGEMNYVLVKVALHAYQHSYWKKTLEQRKTLMLPFKVMWVSVIE